MSNCKGFSFQNGHNKCWMKTTNISESPHMGNPGNVNCGGRNSGWHYNAFDFYDRCPAADEICSGRAQCIGGCPCPKCKPEPAPTTEGTDIKITKVTCH